MCGGLGNGKQSWGMRKRRETRWSPMPRACHGHLDDARLHCDFTDGDTGGLALPEPQPAACGLRGSVLGLWWRPTAFGPRRHFHRRRSRCGLFGVAESAWHVLFGHPPLCGGRWERDRRKRVRLQRCASVHRSAREHECDGRRLQGHGALTHVRRLLSDGARSMPVATCGDGPRMGSRRRPRSFRRRRRRETS